MKCSLLAIVRRHTEWGPDAAGATSANLLQGDSGGARRRPLLRFLGSSWKRLLPIPVLTPGPGTDGNHSCGLYGVFGRRSTSFLRLRRRPPRIADFADA